MELQIKNKILELVKKQETPFYIFNLKEIYSKYNFIKKNLGQAKLFYALKANSEEGVLEKLNNLNSNFEIVSKEELQKLVRLKVGPERIIFSNPIKKVQDIKFAYNYGIKYFVFDNISEFNKIKKIVKNPDLILRIHVADLNKNIGIDFGATVEDLKIMIKEIKDFSKQVKGLTFYGDIRPSIFRCLEIKKDFFPDLKLINIGGGFQLQDKYKDYKYFKEINEFMRKIVKDMKIRFYVEPGLYIVNSAGYLVSKVLSSGYRNNKYFVYLDSGKPSGLINKKCEYEQLSLLENNKVGKVYFYGPTCDNSVLFEKENVNLPQINDILCFKNLGAYSVCYANNFHSFKKPEIFYI